jgi:flagellar protein FlaG
MIISDKNISPIVPDTVSLKNVKVEKSSETTKITPRAGSAMGAQNENNTAKLVAELNAQVNQLEPKLDFSYNNELDLVVVKVVDGETEKVIRQIPSKEMVQIAEHLRDMEKKGILLHEAV